MEKQNGHNWWCSLFPALCFTNSNNGEISKTSQKNLEKNLSKEEMEILLEKTPKIKFKIIELFNK